LATGAGRENIDLIVIGPDNPLADGLADRLRERGFLTFGPGAEGARLEGSKIYAKEFMVEAGIPTARFAIVASAQEALLEARRFAPPYVLKADGLALGKGVFICADEVELRAAAQAIFVDRVFGAAGDRALLEEFTRGYEVSFLALTNGSEFEPLVLAQDHKRLLDGNRGPNTGGMGTLAPLDIDPVLRARIEREVFAPTMALMKKRGFDYRGVLFVGLMIGEGGPSVLEFNVRFGDPETQVILPLMDGDWGLALREVALGRVPRLSWKSGGAACVVLAAQGYPDAPVKGVAIEGIDEAAASAGERAYILHAGSKRAASGEWLTNGGRVLNAVGFGRDAREALARAYARADRVSWPGRQLRRDLGQ
jgi:phosphoribosylamine--glycine ligase